jgi:hypothetical protein
MTREEFKARWESPNCDITYEDVANCAKEWGLYSMPRCSPLDQVQYRVLVEAGCSDAEEYNPFIQEEENSLKMYVARDYDGYIFLYAERPKLLNGVWNSDRLLMLNETDFPEVTFENSPMEVELKLIEK